VVTKDIPGIGVRIFSSRGANHTRGRLEDTFNGLGRTRLRVAAEVST